MWKQSKWSPDLRQYSGGQMRDIARSEQLARVSLKGLGVWGRRESESWVKTEKDIRICHVSELPLLPWRTEEVDAKAIKSGYYWDIVMWVNTVCVLKAKDAGWAINPHFAEWYYCIEWPLSNVKGRYNTKIQDIKVSTNKTWLIYWSHPTGQSACHGLAESRCEVWISEI